MKFLCDSNYLKFPVNGNSTKKTLLFKENDKLIFDLEIELDYITPNFYTYVNVERFAGKTLTLEVDPEMEIKIEKADKAYENQEMYKSEYKPICHFTPTFGWINDPNGLFYYNGEYHMFYQYNPVGCQWGNMHWGHAISKDLVNWEEQPVALYPNKLGTVFSGSAFVDINNRSGLKKGEHPPILLYYTAAGGSSRLSKDKKFTQCIAYSNDGGKTFTDYEKNPIIENIVDGNRDPKVEYDEKTDKFVLALYLDNNDYVLMVSDDLLNWKKTQSLSLPEDAECPDFYPLKTADKTIKWVLSGASDRYILGKFDGKHFTQEGEVGRLHYGNAAYAAQSFNNTQDDRRIRVSWNTFEFPRLPFNKQMTFPSEMGLTADGEYLTINPSIELKKAYKNTITNKDIDLNKGEFIHKLDGKCYDITIEILDIKEDVNITIFGTMITVSQNTVNCHDRKAPLAAKNGKVKLRLLIDKLSLEIFIGDGRAFMSMGIIADYNLNSLKIASKSAKLYKAEINEI